ncbi:cupin domain-containing protein [Candidatus Bathyarchaeota archaeon]|nr:cupin domain-containing protein [Candidatus Bathyarchaeota archaeon]
MKVKTIDNTRSVEMLPGIFRKTLVYDEDGMLCHFFLKEGSTIPLHDHEATQLGFVLSGRIEFMSESEEDTTIVDEGASYIIPGGVKHGARMIEDSRIIECFVPSRPEYYNE